MDECPILPTQLYWSKHTVHRQKDLQWKEDQHCPSSSYPWPHYLRDRSHQIHYKQRAKYLGMFLYIGNDLELDFLTTGIAAANILTQVMAGLPVRSVMNPATMPPTIPPMSNIVDKYAASSLVTLPSPGLKCWKLNYDKTTIHYLFLWWKSAASTKMYR